LTMLPDGTVLTSAMDSSARWWDTETGRELRQRRVEALKTWVTLANIRADGQGLFAYDSGNVVHIDLASGATTKVTTEKPNPVNTIHGVSGSAVFVNTPEGKVRLWDPKTGQTVQTFDLPKVVGPSAHIGRAALSPDGRQAVILATGMTTRGQFGIWGNGQICLYNVHAGELQR